MTCSATAADRQPLFIGCASDRHYVEHTAAMLASLDINGDVPDAIVLVAGFDLSPDDLALLRAGAGRLAARMRIIEVTTAMLDGFSRDRWDKSYSLAVLGRLFLPDEITCAGARLVTIDSDMIVNASLQPLFSMRMYGAYVAACHDIPRLDDLNYFNSGLMLIDVDGFKSFDISRRALAWIKEQKEPPRWPDQDALNVVVGHIWYRLDHKWNFHCVPDEFRAMTTRDYEKANVAHFAAVKPWNDVTHPGFPLYNRYREELDKRTVLMRLVADQADAAFISTAHEVLLGYEIVDKASYEPYSDMTAKEVIQTLMKSNDFLDGTLLSFGTGSGFVKGRFTNRPTVRHRLWAIDRLHLSSSAKLRLDSPLSWQSMLDAIFSDPNFRKWAMCERLLVFAQNVRAQLLGKSSVSG